MLGSLGYPWVRLQTRGAAHVTLLEIPHVRSREQLLAPPPCLTSSFFSPRLSTFTAPKDVHTHSSCSGKQMKTRKTLIFQKLWPGWEPASSVPGEDNGEGD